MPMGNATRLVFVQGSRHVSTGAHLDQLWVEFDGAGRIGDGIAVCFGLDVGLFERGTKGQRFDHPGGHAT